MIKYIIGACFHLPVVETLGHVSFRTVSTLSPSSDTQSVTSVKERNGTAQCGKS